MGHLMRFFIANSLAALAIFFPLSATSGDSLITLDSISPQIATERDHVKVTVAALPPCTVLPSNVDVARNGQEIAVNVLLEDVCIPSQYTPNKVYDIGTFPPGNYVVVLQSCLYSPIPPPGLRCFFVASDTLMVSGSGTASVPMGSRFGFAFIVIALLCVGLKQLTSTPPHRGCRSRL